MTQFGSDKKNKENKYQDLKTHLYPIHLFISLNQQESKHYFNSKDVYKFKVKHVKYGSIIFPVTLGSI